MTATIRQASLCALAAFSLSLLPACGGRNSEAQRGDSGITGTGTLGGGAAVGNTDYAGTSGSGVIYTFVGWDANPAASQYPQSMTLRCTDTVDPGIATTVSGTYSGHTNNSATGFGARGEGLGGISVLNTGTQNSICSYESSGTAGVNAGDSVVASSGITGGTTVLSVGGPTELTLSQNATGTATGQAITVAGRTKLGDITSGSPVVTNVRSAGLIAAIDTGTFDTTGLTGMRVFFEAAQISDQTREYALRLQYSTNNGVSFVDAPGPVEFSSVAAGTSTAYRQFGPVTIPAIDNQAQVILRWRYYFVSGSSGSRTRIALRNIRISNDQTLPTFAGLTTATAANSSTINLSWSAATDTITTASYMRYDIYQATTSGGQNFTGLPNYTVRGITSAQITNLAGSTQYYFVVRARDEQGNREGNTVEVSATTPADTVPPTVTAFNPAAGGSFSAFNNEISVTFDKPMDPATLTASSFKVVQGTDCSAAGLTATGPTASLGNTVFTLTLTAARTIGLQYTTCVTGSARSASNVALSATSATWTAINAPIYSLTSFASGATLASAGITIRCTSQLDNTLASPGTIGGSYSGATSVAATSFGVLGLGANGISVLNTGTANSNCLYSTTGTEGLSVGNTVSGTGIPGGATIVSVDGPTQITLSANATASTTGLVLTANGMAKSGNITSGSNLVTNLASIGFVASIDIPVDTTGRTGIVVSYDVAQHAQQTREWGYRLQYSTNGGSTFVDATNSTWDYDSAKAGAKIFTDSDGFSKYGPFLLPASADNNANVVLRWRYFSTSGSTGSRTRLALNNINVTSGGTADSTAPSVVTLSGTGSSLDMPLTWSAATDAVTPSTNIVYQVHMSTSSGFTPGAGTLQFTTLPNVLGYTVTGLTAGVTHYFKVRAVDSAGNFSTSNELSYTPALVLNEPTSVTLTAGAGNVVIGWTNSTNANAGVVIVRATGATAPSDCTGANICSGSGCNTTLTAGSAGRTFTDTGVSNGTQYAYRVCANHTSPPTVSAGVLPTPATATPVDTFEVTAAASTGNTSATVTFSAAPTAGTGATGAENQANYKIVPGAGACGATIGEGDTAAIAVSGASLSGSVVTLTTGAQTGSTSYKVCVFNVTRALGGLALNTNNNATFTGTGAGPATLYTFTNWPAASVAGTYPTNMELRCVGSSDPANNAVVGNLWSAAYNLTSNARILGKDANGVSFFNTGTGTSCTGTTQFAGVAILSVDTTGRTGISIAWTGRSITAYTAGSNRQFKLTLEYSTDGGSSYAFATEEYLGQTPASSFQNLVTNLPAAANNNPNVRLRWRYVYVTGTGARQELALDEISITGN